MTQNYQEAVTELKQAFNVTHWNLIRESLKSKLTTEELSMIDGSGLIVNVLGKDK